MNSRFNAALIFVLAVAVFVGVLAARSQPSTAATPTVATQPTPLPTPLAFHVNIEPAASGNPSARFVPSPFTIHVGQRATWVNVDSVTHTATADNGAFNSGVLLPGQHFSWRPLEAGTYRYTDFTNPDVRGVITVLPSAPG